MLVCCANTVGTYFISSVAAFSGLVSVAVNVGVALGVIWGTNGICARTSPGEAVGAGTGVCVAGGTGVAVFAGGSGVSVAVGGRGVAVGAAADVSIFSIKDSTRVGVAVGAAAVRVAFICSHIVSVGVAVAVGCGVAVSGTIRGSSIVTTGTAASAVAVAAVAVWRAASVAIA